MPPIETDWGLHHMTAFAAAAVTVGITYLIVFSIVAEIRSPK